MTDSLSDAKRYSLKLLGYRGRSESELKDRLARKGFSGEVISCVVEKLRQSGYLDEGTLAADLKRQALENKLLGYEAAKVFMMKRGLPKNVIEATLGYDEEIELRNLQKLVDKKLRSMGNYLTERGKKRLIGFLARKGYSFSAIKNVLKDLNFEEEVS